MKKTAILYIFEKLKRTDYILLIGYLLLNLLPPLFLNSSQTEYYILVVPTLCASMFVVKSPRNMNLLICWLVVLVVVYFYQSCLLSKWEMKYAKYLLTKNGLQVIHKSIGLPLVVFIYEMIFRILFILKYRYEPSIYGVSSRILQNIFGKNTKKREDYIWFMVGRVLIFLLILFLYFTF